jgi:hypothetical protein
VSDFVRFLRFAFWVSLVSAAVIVAILAHKGALR